MCCWPGFGPDISAGLVAFDLRDTSIERFQRDKCPYIDTSATIRRRSPV